ncbi:MAG TPA: hypothetical protein VHN13_11335 [Candidatus Tectomicrobia bacterium]|nr:hypothetical protein [Candidatus Tectomicrobia bacterium]
MTIKNCISSLIFNPQHAIKHQLEDCNANQSFKPDMSNINVIYGEDLPLAEFDEEQFWKAFTYILIYLISNMKNPGKIVISSTVAQSEYHDKSICITITGIGCELDATELQQLFDPFNIEESNLIDVGPCIAQKIIEEHNGHLNVRQTKKLPDNLCNLTTGVKITLGGAHTMGDGHRLLVVDDELGPREALRMILNRDFLFGSPGFV